MQWIPSSITGVILCSAGIGKGSLFVPTPRRYRTATARKYEVAKEALLFSMFLSAWAAEEMTRIRSFHHRYRWDQEFYGRRYIPRIRVYVVLSKVIESKHILGKERETSFGSRFKYLNETHKDSFFFSFLSYTRGSLWLSTKSSPLFFFLAL